MKKYIQPQTQVVKISVRQFITASITQNVYKGGVDVGSAQSEKIEFYEGDDDWQE